METLSDTHRRASLLHDIAAEPPVPCKFKVGDTVTFTNPAGVVFRGLKVLGFGKVINADLRPDSFIYLDWECYWYLTSPDTLKLESPDDTPQEESRVERFLSPMSDSVSFASWYLKGDGWETVIDNGLQGFWINRKTLELCTYCEGHIVLTRTPDQSVFDWEYDQLCSWYDESN